MIYNPRSGSALPLPDLKKKCHEHTIKIDRYIPVSDGYEQTLKRVITDDTIVAVYGGDGTISNIAQFVQESGAILAPLPGGTMNHFTKDLGVPQDLGEALEKIKSSRPRKVDIASINKKIFINNSSIGIYPHSLQQREQIERSYGKWLSMLLGTLKAIFRFHTYQVSISGKQTITPFIFIGNNEYHFDTPFSLRRQKVSGGSLSAYTINASTRWQFIKACFKTFIGQNFSASEVTHWKAKEITIQSSHKNLKVSRDGELDILTSPLEYRILPRQLTVIGNS